MEAVRKIKETLLTVTDKVFHHHAHEQTDEYLVYAEDNTASALYANGTFEERAIEGTIDLFTKETDDYTLFNKVESALKQAWIPFRLNYINYEPDTGYKHYEWVWQWYG